MVLAARFCFGVIFIALIYLFHYLTGASFWHLWVFMLIALAISVLQDLVIEDVKAYVERNK